MANIGTIGVTVVANTAPLTANMRNARIQTKRFGAAATATAPAVSRLTVATSALTRSLVAMNSSMASSVVGVSGMSGGLTALVGVAAVTAFALFKLTKSNELMNRSMTRSLAIMGNVSDVLRKEMTDAAITASRTTRFSATEAADAYFFLASAGLDAEQSIAALPQVAKFGQAGLFDLSLATDLATDAQSALGLTVNDSIKNLENLKRVTDVLVGANTLANASVEQFSVSLTTKAGASLRQVNKSIEEGVAVLAVFADQGVKGQEAGTALSIVLRDLQTKAIKNAAEFRRMNIGVFDLFGNMRNLADITSDMEKALAGMSDQMKKTTLLNLGFSDKSVVFIQSLLGMSDQIREYQKLLEEMGGITDRVANKNMTDMEKAAERVGAAWSKFAEQFEFANEASVNMQNQFASLLELLNGDIEPGGVFDQIRLFVEAMKTGHITDIFANARGGLEGTPFSGPDRGNEGFAGTLATRRLAGFTEEEMAAKTRKSEVDFLAEQLGEVRENAMGFGSALRDIVPDMGAMGDNIRDRLTPAIEAAATAFTPGPEGAKLRKFAAQLTESTMTPLERFGQGMDEINRVFNAGFISEFTRNRAVEQLKAETGLNGEDGPGSFNQRTPLRALERGTAEAFTAAMANMGGGRDVAKDQLSVAKEQLEFFKSTFRPGGQVQSIEERVAGVGTPF